MLLKFYHATIWGNGAWTVKRKHAPLEELFPVVPQVEDDDDE